MAARTPSEWFRDRLRTVRERKGWKQKDVAQRVTEMGFPMHQTAIAKIEQGERKVMLDDALRLAAALDVSPLSLILPYDDDDDVVLAPDAVPMAAQFIRAWTNGTLPLTALAWADSDQPTWGATVEHRTLDGKVLSGKEAFERRRFYETEVSSLQWKAHQVPGLTNLRQEVEAYVSHRAAGSSADARKALDEVAAEVERQRAALETEGRG